MKSEEYLFYPTPYYPALVLIRIPVDPNETAPAPDADFGSGFFGGCERLVFTARHNLVDLRTDKPFDWVWVCCYEESTNDWTDCRKVKIDPNLLDKATDAALLCVDGVTPGVLFLSLDWRRGDDVAVIGFQEKPIRGTGSGFEPRCISCMLPRNWPIDAQDIEDPKSPSGVAREPYLGLQFTTGALYSNERVLRGFSGGPVIDLQRGAARVIAIEKAIQPVEAEVSVTLPPIPSGTIEVSSRLFSDPYVLSTPMHWVKPLFDKLSQNMRPAIHSPEDEVGSQFQSPIEEKSRDFIGREFVFAALGEFLDADNRGYFVIEGEPGIGKTSLSASLVKTHKYVHHFNDELSGMNQAEHFLENVCLQLIERYQRSRHYDPQVDFHDGRYLNRLLEDVSRNLTGGERVIILVDALDEAEKMHEPGANLLYLPSRLPRGIYFVLTTRPLRDLPLFVDCPRKNFSLEPESRENLADVRHYIELVISRGPLLTRIRAAQLRVDEFLETLLSKSEGNFMYLHYVLPELESGEMREDELPQGLGGYYERHWQKMKARDLDQWLKLQQPVICILAAVREPVAVRHVVAFTPGLTPAQVAAVIGEWRQFLKESWVEGERRYRLYHTSFQDFLKKKDEVDEIDLKQTHRNIAQVLKQWWRQGKG
jgi:hypothetical protein